MSFDLETACRAAIVVFSLSYLCFLWKDTILRRRPFKEISPPATPVTSGKQNKDRENGEWIPEPFTYPTFGPVGCELSDINPIPYRPFRWGQYHVTMGLRNMPWDDWIQLDNEFPQYHKIKTHRAKTRGDRVVRTLPDRPGIVRSGDLAAKELVHELAEYLSRRYPTTYKVERGSKKDEGFGWYGLPQIRTITIVPVGATYDLDSEDPMKVSGLLIQDDLALMVEGSDGRYYFQAGAIMLPGFWRMQDKIGMPLEEIHLSGNVPQYKEKLHTSMARFFKRMPVDKPVIRNNYFLQVAKPPEDGEEVIDPQELAWSNSTNGDEDAFTHGTPGVEQRKERVPVVLKEDVATEAPDYVLPRNMRLRTERQTLRRLPRSGAIAFTIRTYLFSVEDLAKEKGVPGRMASAIRSWPEDVAKYKGRRLYQDILLPYLDERHRMQLENGEAIEGEHVADYPF
ncbi:hypothetical protein GLOTRDRAFT_136372 [Gloeophyllum trabeum ATCC 11539]|uniref:HRQ family protein n=1 Tax=Gloeophyllum trabeum (strain ATCC 11539 / FP-39264 / Madison 617) TaxID=670483 RepID=S7QJY1_GLOTA|nr:uncharacterized protein GLOTRDRAFT_136372 [Gloeophyllum trabeum ATCC 11539]EPQ59518.1 hypothetical protein GLOTRDRAFT_136372 [Gloeophyllum trabeum ATCC 11539]